MSETPDLDPDRDPDPDPDPDRDLARYRDEVFTTDG